VDGGIGDDVIQGNNGADTLLGNDDNDVISGNQGDDSIDGGEGQDSLFGNNSDDTITGGGGNDYLIGDFDSSVFVTDGDDDLSGGEGDDTVDGRGGDDVLNGGTGNDTIYGSDGNDVIGDGSGRQAIFGGEGNDDITARSGVNGNAGTIQGDAGDDMILFEIDDGTATGVVFGDEDPGGTLGDGNDDITLAGRGAATAYGAFGDDVITGSDDNQAMETLSGDAGNDSLYGGGSNDSLAGGAGNDLLEGGTGNDDLSGGAGNDDLRGGSGIDYLFGDEGNDILRGGGGADSLHGGLNDDVVYYDPVDAAIRGGEGIDVLIARDIRDVIFLDSAPFQGGIGDPLNGGFETIDLGGGNDVLIGDRDGGTDSGALRVLADVGNDIVSLWGDWDDTIEGGSGIDSLYGGGGGDSIFGGADQDFIYGGAGDDMLWGGGDNDVYYVGRGDGTNTIIDETDGSEDNGLVLFHGYNDPEFDDFYGVAPEDVTFGYNDADNMVTLTIDNDDGNGPTTVTFEYGTIETLNLWDHADVIGGPPPQSGDFDITVYDWDSDINRFVEV
jgi:Ca2+-binding RTX toxin-like protein